MKNNCDVSGKHRPLCRGPFRSESCGHYVDAAISPRHDDRCHGHHLGTCGNLRAIRAQVRDRGGQDRLLWQTREDEE